MTDRYVYHFTRIGTAGSSARSGRRATLEAIKNLDAEPLMETQLVVDCSEVDDNGFVIGHPADEYHHMDALWAQIRSLERRAQSRDQAAILLDDIEDAREKYVLSLESRALRSQAQVIRKQRTDWVTSELAFHIEAGAFIKFAAPSTDNGNG